jgi:hypothetical protein
MYEGNGWEARMMCELQGLRGKGDMCNVRDARQGWYVFIEGRKMRVDRKKSRDKGRQLKFTASKLKIESRVMKVRVASNKIWVHVWKLRN